MTRMLRTLVAAAAALGLAAPVLAGEGVLPEPTKKGEVAYLSGGVGDREQKAIEEKADEYDLQVTIAKPNGAYLTGSTLRIEKSDGTEMLATTTRGPVLLADLPAGRYTLHASLEGHESEKRTVDVSADDPTRMVVTLAEKEKVAGAM